MNSTHQVIVVPHDPEWVGGFLKEAASLKSAFGEMDWIVHHIGSTAIPGLCAKPIIDILIEVHDVSALDAMGGRMESLGYEVMGEFGIPGRRYFRKNNSSGTRTHQIHAFEKGSPQARRHLLFRDYLVAHPLRARAYEELKLRLAENFPRDLDRYCEGKDDFIKGIDAKAAAWHSTLHDPPT